MKKLVTGLILGLCCWAAATVSHARNYALCTGLNEYSDPGNDLDGCVPDAKNVFTNITLRGEWKSADATLFTNSQGTYAAVSNKLMSFASSAVSGDVVLYYQSSHGYQSSGKNTGICMYDKNMSDSNFAKILANFKAGVKVVIVLDTCHSGGMFKSARRDGTAELSSPFDFAQRVNEELAAIRADEAARGIRTAAKLAVLDCAWITAADYDQYSWDGDEGGKFTVCFVGSVKSGACDKSPYGNGDSYATFQEMFDYAVAQNITHGNGKPGTEDYTMPQCTNTTVLSAVTFGWVGKEAPGGIRFSPIPDQTATVGAPLAYTLVASNTDGSTGTITYSVASSTAPAGSYSLSGANFTFTPPSDGSFSFDFLGTNTTAHTGGKASMTVTASLAAPSGLANSGITPSSFTASWNATAGATSYLLDVASTAFGAKAAGDDVLLNEDFSAFTGTSADRSSTLDTYLAGTGWTGSKVFENAGSAKLGSGSYNGWIATPELDLSSGGTVSFLLTQYGTDANTVSVSILADGTETEIGSATPGSAETVEFAIPAASAATSVKIATSAKRAIIDDLVVTGGSAADVLAGQEVAGTSFTVDGLNTGTYYWRVRAVGNAKGPFSETMDVDLVADPSAPPSIRAIDDIEIEVGETATAQVKVSAPDEAPVTSLSITDGDPAATLEDGVFSFAPAAPGTYDFTITAVNANGPASVSFAVVASLAEPGTPVAPAEGIASDSFTAEWEAVPGAASYELVVIEGQGGSSGGGSGGSGAGSVLTETFANATYSTTGSGYANQTITGGTLGTWTATQCRGDQGNPTVGGTGDLTSPEIADGVSSVEFDYSWPFSETTSCDIDLYVGGNKVASANVTGGTAGTATYSFDAVPGATSVQFVNTHATAKKMRIRFDEIRITTASAKAIAKTSGDVVFSNNVGNVTSYEVTGLQSSTEYTFAFRAIAENGETTDWSAPVTVKTDDGPSAPAWSAIPAQHAYVGATFQLDLSGYLSGSPVPTVTADVGTVTGLHYVYEPDAVGPLTVTLTAVNDSGTATTTFTITVDEAPVGGNHYAVVVGCNKYDQNYISNNNLNGCVPDANHVQALITSRGQWDAANVTKLTDSSAKHDAVLSAIASAASKAIPGDTFLYFHSSHGGNYTYTFVTNTALYTDWPIMVYSVDPEGVDNCICTYDADFTAAELASALAAFDPAVNIVVMIDACHSAGMFQYDGSPVSQRAIRRNAAGKAMRPADPGLFAEAVGAQIGAIRRARGVRAAANVAFVTAANFDEYSFDSQSGDGGEFTTAFIEGVTNGLCDGADYGDQDGWATFYEGWNYAKDIATGIPEGTEVDYDGHAVDANGYALYDNADYTGYPYYEPAYYYDYYFTHPQIDNESLLRVVRVGYAGDPSLDAPVAAEAANVTASGFTASWSAVDGATGYHLQVATDPSFSTGAASDTIVVDDLAATGTSYTDFSDLTKDSGAVYAGTSAKSSSGAIQLNNTKSAGIWTTASGGTVSRVAVEWNDATSDGRTIKVYGSDSPLTSYSAVAAATSLGSIVYGTSSELAIEGSYAYVGFITSGGALYLDSITFDWGTAGSESSIVFDQDVGNVTSGEVSGLEPETDYWYRVQALGDPVDSDFSNVIALTTEASAPYAPVWSEIPPQTAVVGEALVVELKGYVTGSPKPTITADVGTVENSILTVSFAEPGDYTVTLTAENSEGSDTATLAVSVTTGPVTVPTLNLSNPTSEGFDASWDACTGVSSYTLQIATDDQFSAGSAGGEVELFVNPASSVTAPEGWTYAIANSSGNYLQLTSTENSVVSPAVSTKGLTSLTISFEMRTYNGTSGDSGTALVEYSTDGSTWAELGTAVATSKIMSGRTVDASAAIGLDSVQFRWTAPNAVSSKGVGIQSLALTGTGSAGDGSLVKELTVEGTSTTVTGLDPETLYYARVKGEADWSEVKSITTEADVPSAPVWSEIPPQTVAAGQELVIDLTAYVSGSPKPTITADAGTVENGVLTVSFADAGPYTVNLTAENSEGSVSTTLAVTVTVAPVTVPVLTLSNPTDSTFDADWTACTGASEYQFQVASDDQFTPGGGGGGSADVTETFANATFSTTSSSYTNQTITGCDLGTWTATSCRGDSTSPIVRYAGTLTSPSLAGGVAAVEFDYEWPYKESGTCDIDLYVNGTKVGSATVTGGEAGTASYNGFTAVSGPATIEFLNTGTSNKRMQITQVRITSASRTAAKDGGSLLLDTTTNGISLTVTGLEPDTTYYARVRMAEGEWSAVESITTTGEGPAGPAKYAVCVGLSEYDMAAFAEMGLEVTPLKGCVNDATYFKKNLTERGGWAEGNVSLLTNGSATKAAIRGAIRDAAATAQPGDTFVYEHSSHGGQGDDDDDYTAALVVYENLYKDYELAEDLAAFADGVKVVILIDACHSGGMFEDDENGDAEPDGRARSAASFDIAARVSALMDANRAARKARGEDVSRTLAADQIGWVTASTYEETSKDAGYYDTDAWMDDDEADGEERGGAFLAALAWGWWSGKADVSGEGDGDGWFDAYEGWSFSTPVCAEYDQTPQFLNEDVLRAVELGWVGDTAPSDAILFDPVPGAEVAIGEEATLAVVAKNADGTTDGITLSIVATDPEGLDYTFADGALAFTPAEDGLFLFTVQAVKGRLSATKILGVTAVLPAPVAQEVDAAEISEDGFTARWLGVDAARNYQIQVSTDPDFPMGEPEELIEEGFDEVTNTVSSLPEGWEFTGTFGTYPTTGGESAPSIKLSTDGATLTTPTFELTGKESGLSFWVKGNGSGTNMTSTLTVQQLVGEEWQTLENGTFVPSTTGETKEFEGLDPDATCIQFVMAKTSGNIAIDDVMVAQLSSPVIVDDDEIPAGSTSYAVEDLEPGTTYYFRVRAIANTKSAWSDVIEVATAGEKPIPVPDLTVMAPEISPDTSLAAFWGCTGAEQFRLQVATDEAFASLVVDEEVTEVAVTVTNLTPETTYYVRVCALDGERAGDWSNVESLTTAASGGEEPEDPEIGGEGSDVELAGFNGKKFTGKVSGEMEEAFSGAVLEYATEVVEGAWNWSDDKVVENGAQWPDLDFDYESLGLDRAVFRLSFIENE